MKLFISYPSDQKNLAERLRLALEAEDHEVFTDRAELKEGEPYHEALREAIEDADALVFLITPRSVAPGSYALTELDVAQRRWRSARGRVLPVMAAPTPMDSIPPYLRSVTLLQPKGDLVAETLAAVDRLPRTPPLRRWIGAAGILVLVAAAVLYGIQHTQEKRAQEKARVELQTAELAAVVQLCEAGSHAVAWKQFATLLASRPGDDAVRIAREDCGMRWLREMRIAGDKETFSALVEAVQPVLAQGLATAHGERRADLAAHLGWAAFLRSRDGVTAPDPVPLYKAALADDPANIYAHGMWAHHIAWTTGRLDDEVRSHLEAAVKSTRERPWLRRLQFSIAFNRAMHHGYALEVANQMRANGETPDAAQRDLVWRRLIDWSLLAPETEREQVLSFLSPADALATFEWLYPEAQTVADRQPLHRYALALLRARVGRHEEARDALEALHKALKAEGSDSRLSRATTQLLVQLGKPPGS
ncbi:toll/interleukin-1 receptor domain-containing protein [uncultured Piscinibacter sp.]|uniref:toll/interleukin-1 receptor domain-containing protein n=1 Tax=uncultured Piscinibacter sp. TaxID=1131835 RepID=UPI002602206F|nr:toll/interleukin-1 receptor domain-containing protein [uncultured Piscinibacter sp.]